MKDRRFQNPYRRNTINPSVQYSSCSSFRINDLRTCSTSSLTSKTIINRDTYTLLYNKPAVYTLPSSSSSVIPILFSNDNILLNLHNGLQFNRLFHTTSIHLDSKSKVEESVVVLKEKAKAKETTVPSAEPEKTFVKDPVSSATNVEKVTELKPGRLKQISNSVVAACKHYYHGFKLLYIDTKIAAKLVFQLMKGSKLTRRERRQVSFYLSPSDNCVIAKSI